MEQEQAPKSKHRPKPPPILLFLLLIAILGGAGYWYFSNNPAAWQQTLLDFGLVTEADLDARLTASGFIELNQVDIAAEVNGRIQTITVEEGDPVTAGQVLVTLDDALIEAQLEQARAQIALAEARLAQLKAGVPPEQIAVAEAAVRMAEAQRDAAYQAWQDAILLRDNPQELDAQIDAAAKQLHILELQSQQATLLRQAVELKESLGKQFWEIAQQGQDFRVTIPGLGSKTFHVDFPEGEKQQASVEWNLATMELWQAWTNYNNIQAAYQSTLNTLNTLRQLRDNPLEAETRVIQAEADYRAKKAAVPVAQANVDLLRAGPKPEQIEALEAQVRQAQAQVESLNVQRQKLTLTAPMDGQVVERIAHPGEVAMPGAALLTVANPGKVTLTVFVPESDYGRLRENQAVEVTVDSFPGQVFRGTITHISDEAEFTPKNVQTREERVSTVYAIKITLPNPDGRLKPGMPADVVFVEALQP
ncbi:MAG: HlyD family efflux transporter periplasmic adaptor subunit [Caldilineae bacterium]|nr:MAG: HlyD family efflux transporter periplasmic adaptor subunit [Caldilineae bacterium]